MQVALVVEPEGDPVLVVPGTRGAEHVRAEVAGELVGGSEDAVDPPLELTFAPGLYPSRGHRCDG